MPVEIAYERIGSTRGPALLLSSSLGTNREMWEPQIAALSERFQVIAYDHRGHGSSPVPDGPYSLADLGDDVIDLLDRLSIERASFAGISLGGMVGMWLGVNAPDRVDRLALLCTFAESPSREMWVERAATVRESGTGVMVEPSIDRWFTAGYQEAQPDSVNRFRRMLEHTPDEGYAGCCEAIATLAMGDSLHRISATTLVIAGTHDAGATPDIGRRLASSIPGARYAEVKAAHLANVEAPGAVSSLLMEHFAH